jgi:hypothetical protein
MKCMTFVAAALLLAGSTAHAEVRVTLHDGLVTVVARDATVSQILTEWARVGKTTIVNVERIPGGPISVELTDLPEEQALEVLLRSVSGYMAAPRAAVAANLSRLDRVVVLPTSVAPKAAVASVQPTPVFGQPPRFGPPAPPDENAEDDRPAVPGTPSSNPRGPIFNTFPQPQVVNPQVGPVVMPQVTGGQAPVQQPAQPPTYSSSPTAPFGGSSTPTAPFGGVAVPGMMVPAPQPQPGQIVTPPVRRPDGPGPLDRDER